MGESRPSRPKRKTTAPSSRSESRRPSVTPPDSATQSVRAPRLRLVTAEQVEPIRWNKVMTAQARIAVGYYERADVLESLADAVLSELDEN
jgi:hypothetical protein